MVDFNTEAQRHRGALKPYSEYRETGLAWLPTVPKGWRVERGKILFTVVNERSTTGAEKLLSVSEHLGVIERSKADVTMFMAESYEGYKLCWPDDLVINSLWAWSYGMGFSHDHGIISTAYSVYRLKDKSQALPEYYNYFIRGTDFHWEMRTRSKGLWKSRYQLSDSDFLTAPMLIPPPDEQRAIVAYLDEKTAKMDRLIALKEREVALLNEKKQAMISRVVTRGLDPNAELVDSGVDWIGKVPKGWRVIPLKRVIASRTSGSWGDDAAPGTGDICLRIADFDYPHCIFKDTLPNALTHRSFKDSDREWIFLRRGDILVEKSGGGEKTPVGRAVIFDKDYVAGYANFMDRIRVASNNVDPWFFLFWWRSMYAKSATWPYVKQTTGIQNLDFKNLLTQEVICFPPLAEQRAIVAYLDEATAKIDRAVAAIERSIELLKERKTRLVSDVVTGKVDVRYVSGASE